MPAIENLSAADRRAALAGLSIAPTDTAAQAFKAPGPLGAWQRARHLASVGLLGRNARILIKGDSKSMGAGQGVVAGNSSNYPVSGAATKNYPMKVAEGLRRAGYNVTTSFWNGYRGVATPADFMAYDARVSGITNWSGGARSLGGGMFSLGVNDVGSFAPDEPVNRVSVLYRDAASRPDFVIGRANSDPVQTIVPAKPSVATMARANLSFATLDASAITVARKSDGSFPTNTGTIIGIIAWNSNKPGIEMLVDAVYGISTTTAAEQDTTGTGDQTTNLNAVKLYAPDLSILRLGTNDFAGTALATTITNMGNIIDACLASGSVILTFPAAAGPAGGTSGGSDAQRATAKAAFAQLAIDKGVLFADEDALVNGRAVTGSFGAPLFFDTLHENEAGAAFLAHPMARLISS